MAENTLDIVLLDETDTIGLATRIAPHLRAGDTLLLEGQIGAGKSAFARALIRARLGRVEDVPSPTFTIVQTYDDADCEIWHCDLYRLTHPDEALELGLEDAFSSAICLIEWPDRLGSDLPANAATLSFKATETAHHVKITLPDSMKSRLLRAIQDA
ncbi:MAG: tRNA (adenosine(37)-N6)-threonylcarbamoyltransferase complex ATPase subunit type 1 TsaE [Yoonia sp.]|jgi:tRNA threonylcarbamoyladenosine biosynthesis protein TsaE|nr:tRNA (adenosine(37)-N6)-threonylcarbamoyltransferase complex ATPase subunit type 1 TsaE [Yoonia sp.]